MLSKDKVRQQAFHSRFSPANLAAVYQLIDSPPDDDVWRMAYAAWCGDVVTDDVMFAGERLPAFELSFLFTSYIKPLILFPIRSAGRPVHCAVTVGGARWSCAAGDAL